MTTAGSTSEEVAASVRCAAEASVEWRVSTVADRVRALTAVADALDAHSDELITRAQRETHLADARLRGELRRTCFQLRYFGDVLEEGSWLDARIDHADVDWPMGAPRPDLRRQLEPIGPVLVFAASNFPFAFSVAGGDTASALAAGNAVVLKAHPGHPDLSVLTTRLVQEALRSAGAVDGLFGTVYGTEAGVQALRDPLIRAAAFTGSIPAGRALFDIAAARPEPIPFYGELGSVNPAFVTRSAAAEHADEIAQGFVASVTGSAGQLCTKPGLLLVPTGYGIEQLFATMDVASAAPLLNGAIATGFRASVEATASHADVAALVGQPAQDAEPSPVLFKTTAAAVQADPTELISEMFGPAALVATYEDEDELITVAQQLDGQLTATVFGSAGDAVARDLVPLLATKAGRILWNQWPTGVSVTWAQQHGGPYPATTSATTTSVGAAAMTRFLRPVTYQNVPDGLLPAALQDANPLGIPRRVDGTLRVSGG